MGPVALAADPIIVLAPSAISAVDRAKANISVAQTIEVHGGKPERLFGGSIDSILHRLEKIFGVGPGIARMIVIQRMLYFWLTPPGSELLPKTDVHVMRVFARTGVVLTDTASDKEVRSALVDHSPHDIAIIDQVARKIGRNVCSPKNPNCPACPLRHACEYHSRARKGSP